MSANCTCGNNHTPAAGELPAGSHDANPKGRYVHRVPTVPFTIDGERGRPIDLVRLRDRPLHTVVRAGDDGEFQQACELYTSDDTLRQGLGDLVEKQQALLQQPAPPVPGQFSTFQKIGLGIYLDLHLYQHVGFGGCEWEFTDQDHTLYLLNFGVDFACGFLWWGWKQLDNQASSIIVSTGLPLAALYDDWYNGGQAYIMVLNDNGGSWGGYSTNLVPYGWNDRASSFGFPFKNVTIFPN